MPDVRTEQRFPDGHLAEAWIALVDADPSATVFHSVRFQRLWCRYLRGRCELRLRFVSDGDEVIGVVPEVREVEDGVRTVRFAGGEHVTDYLGPVSLPEHRAEVVGAWLDALLEEDDWDVLRARGLREDAGWHELIAGAADRRGLTIDGPEVEDVAPRVDLTGGWDAYLARLSSKQRHEIRRKARKLARESGTVKLDEVSPVEELDDFVEMHRQAPGEKAGFFDRPGMVEFFRGLVDEFADERLVRFHRLDLDGVPAAYTVSLVQGREWGLYNSAFDPARHDLAPGMVIVGELIRIAADDDRDIFDLLRGAESYKYRFGARDRRVRALTARR